jgi:hypothetical protein
MREKYCDISSSTYKLEDFLYPQVGGSTISLMEDLLYPHVEGLSISPPADLIPLLSN